MAPLTWRNVDDPDLGKAARILEGAVANWSGALNGASDTLATVRDNQRRNRSAAAIPVLAGINGASDVDAALSRVTGLVNPQDMTPELQQAVLNARGTALGYDQTRTSTDSTRSATSRANETHRRGIEREDQLSALAPTLAGAYQESLWGDPYQAAPHDGGPPLNDRELLARTIMAEAGGEGYQGMLAAGSVIANRSRANDGNLRGVIMAPGQFSAWNGYTGYAGGEGGLDMNAMQPNDEAYAAADAIQSGNYQDPTGGATHYYNPSVADPEWGARAGGTWNQIGNHVFGTAAGGAPPVVGGTDGVTVSQRRPIDIAGMIPENNRLGVDFWLSQAEQLYGNQDRAIEEARSDLSYAETRTAAQEAERAADEAERLRNEGWELARNLGPDGRDRAQNEIMARGLPEDQTRLLLEGVAGAFDAAPAYYAPSEGLAPSDLAQTAMAQLEMNAGIADDKNPLLVVMESLGLSSPGDLDTDAAISGSGVAEEVKRQGVTDIVGGLMGKRETLDLREDPANIIGIVNEISGDLGVDPRMVAGMVENALAPGFWGGTMVDQDRLRSLVQPWADPNERRRLIGIENGQAARREALDAAIADQREAQERLDVYGRRPGSPERDAALASAQTDFDAASAAIQTVMDEDNRAYGISYGEQATGEEGAADGTEDLVAATSDERRRMILEGETRPTPGGVTVDPSASGFDQMLSRFSQDSEISGELERIRVGLATGGGAPANRVFGSIGDFFRPAAEGQANSERRESMRSALEWFQSEDAETLFQINPRLLEQARRDPVGFFRLATEGDLVSDPGAATRDQRPRPDLAPRPMTIEDWDRMTAEERRAAGFGAMDRSDAMGFISRRQNAGLGMIFTPSR